MAEPDTVTCTEKMQSREETGGDNASARRLYHLIGSADESLVKAALRNTAPLILNTLVRRDYTVRPVFVDSNNPETCVWEGEAEWGRRLRHPDTGDSTYEFDTTGGSEHIGQAIATRSYGDHPFDYGGAIQCTRGGEGGREITIEGMDVDMATYAWSERNYLPVAFVTPAYKADLFWLSKKVNDRTWRGFARGEVRFLGARGGVRSSEDYEMCYSFIASPNAPALTVGVAPYAITGIVKGGWEYLWTEYKTVTEEISGEVYSGKVPAAVYVQQVYQYADFSLLGLGI